MSYLSNINIPKRNKLPPSGIIEYDAKYMSCSVYKQKIIKEKKIDPTVDYSIEKNDFVLGLNIEMNNLERKVLSKVITSILKPMPGATAISKDKEEYIVEERHVFGIANRTFEIKNMKNYKDQLNFQNPYFLKDSIRVQMEGTVNMINDGTFFDMVGEPVKFIKIGKTFKVSPVVIYNENKKISSLSFIHEVPKEKIVFRQLRNVLGHKEFNSIGAVDKYANDITIAWNTNKYTNQLTFFNFDGNFSKLVQFHSATRFNIYERSGFYLQAMTDGGLHEKITFYCYH
jgi:hypothetical protein